MTKSNTPLPPLTGSKLLAASAVLALANFFVVLDITICNVSVPTIAGGLAVSPNQGTWVITSYAVAEAITVPLSGWLSRRFGTVHVFVTSLLLFGLFSGMCGFATSLPMLVAFRVLQGLAGGPLMPMSQTLLLGIYPKEKLAAATGIWAMTTLVAPAAGPILGGHICDGIGWPWVFFINMPVTAICAFAGWQFLRERETKLHRDPIDYVGFVLMVIWIGALQMMLDKGRELDWFNSTTIVLLALTAGIGFISFVIWELTDDHPIVDLRIFRYRGFTAGGITMSIGYGGFLSGIVILPLWLQSGMGYNATSAGEVIALNGVLALCIAPFIGRLLGTGRYDARAFMCFGLFWFGFVTFMRGNFETDMTMWQIARWNLLQGIAFPMFFIPATIICLAPIPSHETASAAGLLSFVRTLGGAFGTSVATTFWDNTASAKKSVLVDSLNNPQATVDKLGQAGFSHDQALSQVDYLVNIQSIMLSTNRVFQISALAFFAAALLIWFAPPSKGKLSSAAH